MNKFNVEVSRVCIETTVLRIDADTEKEAEQKALDCFEDCDFPETEVDWEEKWNSPFKANVVKNETE